MVFRCCKDNTFPLGNCLHDLDRADLNTSPHPVIIRGLQPTLLPISFAEKLQSWSEIKRPSPRIKDELALNLKRAIFPSLGGVVLIFH